MYKILRSILFLFPAEWVHYFSMGCLRVFCSIDFLRKLLASGFSPTANENLQSEIYNLQFKNPVGLGAGFDKNAKYLRELGALGFGFIEIGTVTPLPQAGNDKPRLFRLPKDKALINRMGFNNDGVKVIAERLRQWQATVDSQQPTVNSQRLIIGGNIGKNKITANEDAWKDYEICFKELHHYVDYFVVNVSSPNTPGLRELQEKESLRKILRHLQMINNGKAVAKPILLKIAPDLTVEQLDDVIDLALEIKLDGLVATNTTIDREGLEYDLKIGTLENGGLSGKPLQKRSTEIVKYIFEKTKGEIPIIASGGIFTGTDAKEKFNAGASLVQVWTGFIYEGPAIVKHICKHLSEINN
ncbi:MAG TPA: quinone-dependent dihydroorotate dehydrogenase [Chitinophagaceae bacterium]|jgi:dihydroorotate dehydrogenase|nr:quinone-dependent dihydroorotate dehydrogenase [Chitinophagaceae bacterium]